MEYLFLAMQAIIAECASPWISNSAYWILSSRRCRVTKDISTSKRQRLVSVVRISHSVASRRRHLTTKPAYSLRDTP